MNARREAFTRMRTEILPELFTLLASKAISIQTLTRPLSDVGDAWTQSTPSGVRLVLAP